MSTSYKAYANLLTNQIAVLPLTGENLSIWLGKYPKSETEKFGKMGKYLRLQYKV